MEYKVDSVQLEILRKMILSIRPRLWCLMNLKVLQIIINHEKNEQKWRNSGYNMSKIENFVFCI